MQAPAGNRAAKVSGTPLDLTNIISGDYYRRMDTRTRNGPTCASISRWLTSNIRAPIHFGQSPKPPISWR
jgi:hypothetical protein